jgi:hypothetical protein
MVTEQEAARLLKTMTDAINQKDLDRMVDCFDADYESIQPAHPDRSFRGRDRLADNWKWVFRRFDMFEATVLDFAVRDETIWTEWIWRGIDENDDHVTVRGVMIFTVNRGVFQCGRLYLEPVRP